MILLVAAACLFAFWQDQPTSTRLYLLSQLVYIPAVWGADWLFGPGIRYAIVYSLFTALILLAILRIVLEALKTRQYRLRPMAIAAIFSITLGRMAWLGVGVTTIFDFINLAEGMFLVWASFLLGFSVRYVRMQNVCFTLGLFWLAQGIYSLGWVLHPKSHWWIANNWIAPPLMGTAAFVITGLLLRYSPSQFQPRPRRYPA